MEWQGNLGLKAKLRLGGAGADYAHLETVVFFSLAGGRRSVAFPEENTFGGGGVDHHVAGTGAEVEVRVEHALVVGAEIVGDGEVAELQEQFEVFGGLVSGLDPVRGAADFLFVDGELETEFLAGVGGELGGGDFDVFGFGTEFEGGFEFDVELYRFAVPPDGFGEFGPVGDDRLAAGLDLLDDDGVFPATGFPGFVHARIAGDEDKGDAAGWGVEQGGFDDDLADEEHGDAEFAGLGPGGRGRDVRWLLLVDGMGDRSLRGGRGQRSSSGARSASGFYYRWRIGGSLVWMTD